jgi:hypothetical protein
MLGLLSTFDAAKVALPSICQPDDWSELKKLGLRALVNPNEVNEKVESGRGTLSNQLGLQGDCERSPERSAEGMELGPRSSAAAVVGVM